MVAFQTSFGQQVLGHFPLSRFGLGSYFGNGLVRNEGMASTGIAIPSLDHVNLLNPALLPFNRNANLEIDLWYAHRELKIGNDYSQIGGSGPAQLSVAVKVGATGTMLHSTVMFAGGFTKVGAMLSNTVMVCAQVAELPQPSVAR